MLYSRVRTWWGMGRQTMWQRWHRVVLAGLFAGVILLSGQGWLGEASADTIYTYVDEKGNSVYADKLEKVPEKYRAKAKMHELSDSAPKEGSMFQSFQQKIKDQVKAIRSKGSSTQSGTDWRNQDQQTVLNYAGGAAVFLLLVMYFSKKSPMIRLLALGLLIVLGIGTPVLVYTSAGGALDVMKKKATTSGQAQQDRIQQVPQ